MTSIDAFFVSIRLHSFDDRKGLKGDSNRFVSIRIRVNRETPRRCEILPRFCRLDIKLLLILKELEAILIVALSIRNSDGTGRGRELGPVVGGVEIVAIFIKTSN